MDLIERKAVSALAKDVTLQNGVKHRCIDATQIYEIPSVQPETLSNAYMKAVWTWLIDYQIKAAELKGRYTPYEVLSWVANDWRKEHDGFD